MKTAIRENEVNQTSGNRKLPIDHPVKVTAFLEIVEAVRSERYEEVAEMVKIAEEFGARRWDIPAVLEQGVVAQRKSNLERR